MPEDAGAKMGNWFATDIEKILKEVEMLNPCFERSRALPGEQFHDVGQNPRAASSIGATQHTQTQATSLLEWPLLQLQHNPLWVDELASFVDVCQVGDEQDAFFVKITTQTPASEAVVGMLIALRIAMLREFHRTVDFNLKATPDESGWFVLTLSPIANIEFDDKYIGYNRLTGHDHRAYDIPYRCVDSASCMGSLMVKGDEAFKLSTDPMQLAESTQRYVK